MTRIKKSITIPPQQEAFVQAHLATGPYAADSEVIRDAQGQDGLDEKELGEKEMRLAELNSLRAKLIASETSGPSLLTPEEVRHSARSANGGFLFGLAAGAVAGDMPDFLAPMTKDALADWE